MKIYFNKHFLSYCVLTEFLNNLYKTILMDTNEYLYYLVSGTELGPGASEAGARAGAARLGAKAGVVAKPGGVTGAVGEARDGARAGVEGDEAGGAGGVDGEAGRKVSKERIICISVEKALKTNAVKINCFVRYSTFLFTIRSFCIVITYLDTVLITLAQKLIKYRGIKASMSLREIKVFCALLLHKNLAIY